MNGGESGFCGWWVLAGGVADASVWSGMVYVWEKDEGKEKNHESFHHQVIIHQHRFHS